jgi:hypothetical protein
MTEKVRFPAFCVSRMRKDREKMPRYFLQDTPLAGIERLMMEVPRRRADKETNSAETREEKTQRNAMKKRQQNQNAIATGGLSQ